MFCVSMVKPETMESLVHMVVDRPVDDIDDKVRYRLVKHSVLFILYSFRKYIWENVGLGLEKEHGLGMFALVL